VDTCERQGEICSPAAMAAAHRVTWMGSAGSSRVFLFYIFYFINQGGHQTTSEKVPLTMTFHPNASVNAFLPASVNLLSSSAGLIKELVPVRTINRD
jgi:hypothetical protein